MRKSWVQERGTGRLIPIDEYVPSESRGVQIMPDIQSYQSMITGETISSRSKHRQHLKEHGMIEIGNETSYLSRKKEDKPDLMLRKELEKILYRYTGE